jgi:hypothetical protein
MDTQPTPQTNPEQSIGSGAESAPHPVVSEMNPIPAKDNTAQPLAPPSLTAADVAAAIASVSTPVAPTPADSILTPAADQDIIEPEWVNKAEQVVANTAGNPYAEEEGIEDLQIDYLKQRYGHEVKKPENG